MSVHTKILQTLREKRWARWLGLSLFSWAVFTFSLYLTFPSDAVRDRIVQAARQQGMQVRMESVNLALPLGLTFNETYWILREPDAKAEKSAIALHVSRLTVRPSLLGLITGKKAVSFDGRLWGGSLSGKAAASEEGNTIDARLRGLDLGQSLLGAVGLQVEGTIDELRLSATGSQLADMEGELTLNGSALQINGGEVNHFSLPKIALGDLEGQIHISAGRAEIDVFEANGEDLTARVEGSLRFADRFALSTLQTRLRFKPSEAWWEQNEMLRAGAAMALRKDDEGFHSIQLYGQLGRPRFRMN